MILVGLILLLLVLMGAYASIVDYFLTGFKMVLGGTDLCFITLMMRVFVIASLSFTVLTSSSFLFIFSAGRLIAEFVLFREIGCLLVLLDSLGSLLRLYLDYL